MSETHAQTVRYVRTEMLGEQEPPITEKGAVKWLRENLFSSWLNIFLTVVSLYVVYLALALVLPWAFGGVWNAGSLTECREVLFSFYKGSHDGACWAVIEDRWLQLLFGFYPPELYWRPILAFVLLFVALAPILFADKVPGQLIWFSMIYPFMATWLIWGGSFWVPVLAVLGFVVAVIAYKILSKVAGPIVTNLGAVAAALLWWLFAMAPISDGLHKMIGAGRFDDTVASLDARLAELPAMIAVEEAEVEAHDAVIAAAVAEKDATLQEMVEIRIEEFAIEAQIEPKEVALQRLDGADENLTILADLLAEWSGAPVAASGASEAEIAEATEASDKASALIEDIAGFIADAQNDIANETAEPAEVASAMVARAAQEDPSILEDVAAMVDKSALIEPLTALSDSAAGLSLQSSQDDIAAMKAELGVTLAGLGANIASLETIYDKVVATNADGLVDPQARISAKMVELTALRDQGTVLAQGLFRLQSEQSDGGSYSTSLASLNEREALLPALQEQATAAREALPSSHRGMINVNQLPEDSSSGEIEALENYLALRNQALNAEASVRDTYSELGRVGLKPIDSRQIGGFMLALIIGTAGIVLSLPLGIMLALGRQSHLFIVNKVCVAFIETIRGVPLIVWLIVASLLLNYFLPPGSSFDLMLRVIIMVTLFASAYIAEVIRGGLAALPTGQYEGADSLGLSYWQSMQLIVLPQAMKISIPGIVNTFIGLFKDTVLVVFIGLSDPIGFSNLIRADTDWNGIYWELFVFIGAIFFIFCYSMGRYSLHLERKLQREHR